MYGTDYGSSDHLNFYDELLHIPLLFAQIHPENDKVSKRAHNANLCSSTSVGDILFDNVVSSSLADSSTYHSEYVIAESACAGPCIMGLKPIKIAVRSKTHKLVYFDSPMNEFGHSHVIQFFDLALDPHEKRNLYDSEHGNKIFRDLYDIARQRADTVRANTTRELDMEVWNPK
jgi:hypothetical protein